MEYPKTIQLEVKQEHIDRANVLRGAPDMDLSCICPLALAGQEYFEEEGVTANGITLHNYRLGKETFQYYLGDEARDFICKFDTGNNVQPGKFFMELK